MDRRLPLSHSFSTIIRVAGIVAFTRVQFMPIKAKWLGVAGAALLSTAGLGDAHAGLILSDGFFGTIGSGGTNDLLPSVFGTTTAKGFYGAEVYFTAGWY